MGRRGRFMTNTLVMTAGALALRLINLSFRAWLFVRLGAHAVGEYQLLTTVFFLAVTSCTAGFGFAVTRTVAEGKGSSLRLSMGLSVALSLLAGGVLWLAAPLLGVRLLGGSETVLPLRLLTLGLTPIAVTSCLRGYFVARRRTVLPAIGDIAELCVAIGLTVWLCEHIDPLLALAIGSVGGDLLGCAIMLTGYLSLRRQEHAPAQGKLSTGALAHIAAPVWMGSMGRGALSGLENLLIPRGLSRWGGGDGPALAQYGSVTGMVFPVLYLPLCVLTSAAMLLVPELAEMKVRGHNRSIETAARKSIELTLWFSFLTAAIILFGADSIGQQFFASAEAGKYLRLMSPIIPILYLDSVVDGMLKGLDQQAYSFRYNIIDGVLRVAMAWLLIPAMGVSGYFLLLYLSEIFNCALSLGRLVKVARVRVDVVWWLVAPALAAVTLYLLLVFASRACSGL